MTQPSKESVDAAIKVFADYGIDFRAPWECTLDDLEQTRYEALCGALSASMATEPKAENPSPGNQVVGPNWHAHVGSLLAVIEYLCEATGEQPDPEDAAMVAQINAEYLEASNV